MAIPIPYTKKTLRLRTLFIGLLILLCGFVTGSGTTVAFLYNRVQSAAQSNENFAERLSTRLTLRMGLDDQEQTEIEQIILHHLEAIQRHRNQVRPAIQQELEQINTKVLERLNQEQKQQWKKRFEKIKTFWNATYMNLDSENGQNQ